jgi:hypothetical protein
MSLVAGNGLTGLFVRNCCQRMMLFIEPLRPYAFLRYFFYVQSLRTNLFGSIKGFDKANPFAYVYGY